MLYHYEWYHIETGKQGVGQVSCSTLSDFHEKLNRWNSIGRGKWQYWATVTIGTPYQSSSIRF